MMADFRQMAFWAWLLLSVFSGVESLYRSHRYPTVWSAWSWWSDCSRSCGEGVRRRSRTCLLWAGHKYVQTVLTYCQGSNMDYEFCEHQRCPDDTDFRAYQCSLNDRRHFLFGQAYVWIPTIGQNPCDLNCKAKGYRVHYNFGRAVDGTLCYPDKASVCVAGNCKTVGCDHKIESKVAADNCGVCGGNNTTCRLVRGSNFPIPQNKSTFSYYYDITTIPRGSTNIEIREKSRNFLALFDSRDSVVIDGGDITDPSHKTHAFGSTVKYSRHLGEEVMHVTGPTSEASYVKVKFRGDNRTVTYQYYTDNLEAELSRVNSRVQTDPSFTTTAIQPMIKPLSDFGAINGQALSENSVVKEAETKVELKKTEKKKKEKKKKIKKPKIKKKEKKKEKKKKQAFCKPCKRPRDRKKQFCSSAFVSHIRVADYYETGNETRYDVTVVKTYRNDIPLLTREYVWVPYKCRCPRLKLGQDYVIMGHTDTYKERQVRLVIDYKSYVKKFSEKIDEKLNYLRDKKKCRKSKRWTW